MGTVQEREGIVKTYMIFISLTHTALQSIDSSNHPVHPMLSLLILCALHRNMGGLLFTRGMIAIWAHLLVQPGRPHHAPLLVDPGGPPFLFYIA